MRDEADHLQPDPAREAAFASAHDVWERERDQRLGEFIAARMREVEHHGCRAERAALFWILDVLPQWREARRGHLSDAAMRLRVDALGWVLRLTAHSAWHRHPEWSADFHPQADYQQPNARPGRDREQGS
ncbi:hypothetical protein [Streptomyces sp. NPDC006640]|uniref:hypothetical protein n=1 Tax=unclassified Streptomyces TaxID=2593676 RepID=UPI0036B55886